MALRGTLTHRKTRRLALALGIAPCFAIGLLEALWHTAAEQAPAGDIGRLSNQDIADEMFYDGDADELVAALLKAGWLDKHERCRLVVHDWSQHADSMVHSWLAKRTLLFFDGTPPRIPHEAFDGATRSRIKAEYSRKYPDDSRRTPGGLPEISGELPPIPEPEPEPEVVVIENKGVQGDCKPRGGAGAPWPQVLFDSLPERSRTVEVKAAIGRFARHRKERRLACYQPAGVQALAAKLAKWEPDSIVASIDQTIANNWQGLFEPAPLNGKAPPKSLRESDGELTRRIMARREQQHGA